jgi:hypothetical protein
VPAEQLVSATGYFGVSQVNCSSIFRGRGGILDDPICSLVDTHWLYKSFGEATSQDIPFFQIDCHLVRYLDGVFCLVENQATKLKGSVICRYCSLVSACTT